MSDVKYEELSGELKVLMRTFKNLTLNQVGALLVPFKADQLMSHVLSELNQEQMQTAGGYLKEYLFGNIDLEALSNDLDMDYEKGGAGWNKQRVRSFAERVGAIMELSNRITNGGDEAETLQSLMAYLKNVFKLNFDEIQKERTISALSERIKNKIDRIELQKKLDLSKALGGAGLHKNTAEKISREVEIIMLMKYS